MTLLFDSLKTERLQWLPESGIGWYPVTAAPYDAGYWQNYRAIDRTPIGDALNAARLALVQRYATTFGGVLVDIGIGGGRFITDAKATWASRWAANEVKGFDVNPAAIDWLQTNDLYCDPYVDGCDIATFWDSLEHIHDPTPLLAKVRSLVFVSLPIFSGPEHVLRSKHFKRDEHCWYFTRQGFIAFMDRQGFQFREVNRMEQECGREDIESFAFARRAPA